jgi:tetratricopeptide (TPR) repeat protein
MGQYDEAADFHRQAAAILRAIDDRWYLAIALDNLALTLNLVGDSDSAKAQWREALSLIAEYTDPGAAKLRRQVNQRLADGQSGQTQLLP